ncbi:MAG: type II toxin-antitoxin system VapC family toxin [Bacteroidaceae bacterium]|nr:type II toxin-antitoxin system VapC family toxin [Bacteroidaceae bacterium]
MKGYLLDTSICVFLFRKHPKVTEQLNKIGYSRCFISDIVLAELRYGAYKSDFVEDNLKLIDNFVKKVHVLPFADCIDVYAKEKVRLKKIGRPIEEFDLLIGCAAKTAGLTVVTHNLKHFSHIEGIDMEDWVELI